MSLADEVRTVKQRVAERLAELEPLAREYEDLGSKAGEAGAEGARTSQSVCSGEPTLLASQGPDGQQPTGRTPRPCPPPSRPRPGHRLPGFPVDLSALVWRVL